MDKDNHALIVVTRDLEENRGSLHVIDAESGEILMYMSSRELVNPLLFLGVSLSAAKWITLFLVVVLLALVIFERIENRAARIAQRQQTESDSVLTSAECEIETDFRN